jgi:hypothetical protein
VHNQALKYYGKSINAIRSMATQAIVIQSMVLQSMVTQAIQAIPCLFVGAALAMAISSAAEMA